MLARLSRIGISRSVLALTTLCVGCFLSLKAALPYGVLWADTADYLQQGLTFRVDTPNMLDWRFMPLFSMLLKVSLALPHPTDLLLWLHLILFLGIIICIPGIATAATGSRRMGIIVAFAVLIWEIALMQTFFFLVNIVADTLYTLLTLLGSLLVLAAWHRRKTGLLIVGFGLLGLTMITKPAAFCMLPLWGVFALWIGIERFVETRSWKAGIVRLSLCAGLILPLMLWLVRNEMLYGTVQPNGYLSRNIMARTLPLVEDGDRILEDEQKNADFIRTLRTYEQENGTAYNRYMDFGVVNGFTSPQFFLAQLMPEERSNTTRERPFLYDRFAVGIALHIIALHPREYAEIVLTDYLTLFKPWLPAYTDPGNFPNGRDLYFRAPKPSFSPDWELRALYPPNGERDPSRVTMLADKVLRFANPLRFALSKNWSRFSFGIVAHVLALAGLILILRAGWSGIRGRTPQAILGICTLLLFGNAACNYLLVALVEERLVRYHLSGAMGLNILYILWIVVGVRKLLATATPWRKSNAR